MLTALNIVIVLSSENEKDISKKIVIYNRAMGIVNQVSRPNLVQVPRLQHDGSKTWTICK
jgi:hypothetical protein